ncbi:MAG: N-acetyltransferase [Terracidiphilus sp.]|jgi:ribosomal protein S18 acetylase RimI-like enzyme
MESGASIEILDLRHFAAQALRPLLTAESELWKQRLHWDYNISAKLLLQYLDGHMLPGYAALESGHVTGYVFCVYEGAKAIVGDLFALPDSDAYATPDPELTSGQIRASQISTSPIEATLLRHILELLLNSPQVERIESQLLLHPSGSYAEIFRHSGFDMHRRLFMVRALAGHYPVPSVHLPFRLELRPWREDDLDSAARLISAAYHGHPDSVVNDQYRSVHGSLRFLNNIVRYSGCGVFAQQVSHVIIDRLSREMVALVLGSRVSPESGHITQLCVHPEFRRRGMARMMLTLAASSFLRIGVTEISLTVTEANTQAIELYHAEGFDCAHSFDATVWQRNRNA